MMEEFGIPLEKEITTISLSLSKSLDLCKPVFFHERTLV
jgi:hypothetical protein